MERPSFSKKIEIKEEEEEEEAKIKERQSLKRTKQKAKVLMELAQSSIHHVLLCA